MGALHKGLVIVTVMLESFGLEGISFRTAHSGYSSNVVNITAMKSNHDGVSAKDQDQDQDQANVRKFHQMSDEIWEARKAYIQRMNMADTWEVRCSRLEKVIGNVYAAMGTSYADQDVQTKEQALNAMSGFLPLEGLQPAAERMILGIWRTVPNAHGEGPEENILAKRVWQLYAECLKRMESMRPFLGMRCMNDWVNIRALKDIDPAKKYRHGTLSVAEELVIHAFPSLGVR